MSFVVRVVGPEFQEPESREAFARIEESIRQYSFHARETIALARNPFNSRLDHFVVIWSRGAAIVNLYAHGGRVRGGLHGAWIATPAEAESTSIAKFDNPVVELLVLRKTLLDFVETAINSSLQPKGNTKSAADSEVRDGELLPNISASRLAECTKCIALFTRPVTRLSVNETEPERTFIAMTLEYALSRTMFHLPNLLRVTENSSTCFSQEDMIALSDAFEDIAFENIGHRAAAVAAKTSVRMQRPAVRRNTIFILAAILIAVVAAVFVLSRKDTGSSTQTTPSGEAPPTVQPATNQQAPKSTVIIELPEETQLFVSSDLYATHSELDRALSRGEGVRFLPDVTHVVILDSDKFAKGVYGYFQVQNAWRKGKLLQTFHSVDTFKISNFLPPLP